jgi:hypothetical protein
MANRVAADSPAAAPPMAPKTSTGKTLWVLGVLLLITTVVVGGTSWWVFQTVHSTVETVRNTTAPAIRDVLAAREAIVEADSAAVDSFRSDEVKLTGPGQQYQNQLTAASQRLVQVAERNAADKGSQDIQLLEAELESYSGLIGQAQEHVGTAVGIADLWSASHLLHAGDSPILIGLNNLVMDQTKALNDQITASSMTPKNLLRWVIPIVLLFLLFFATQEFLRRRFRRAVNLPLLFATVALIGLSVVTSLTVVSQHQLEQSRDALNEVVRLWQNWQEQPSAADAQGQRALGELMEKECGRANSGCGPTVDQFVSDHQPTGSTAEEAPDKRLDKLKGEFDEHINSAGEHPEGKWFILILTSLIILLILAGLLPRIEEYRYRPR